ncbi:MAG TPA: DAK2 domain-containing protein [Syntrophomonadaceae bacterium]|nr:DAK2 domain-containing protein [Syntrophomonadaceae bacterium]
MDLDVITGERVKQIFEGGLAALTEHQQEIDRLNVYPVPDGDTGKNLYLTMVSAVKELNKINSLSVGSVSEAVAKGSLLGARGNSGVILSQLIRGFAEAVKGKESISVQEFARAWQTAAATAYRAVIKPVEGTMLTVAREFARSINEAAAREKSLEIVMATAIKEGYKTLQKTPDMLPVLKKAGVVDAGGKGLLVILEGGLQALREGIGAQSSLKKEKSTAVLGQSPLQKDGDFSYLYCVSLLLEADASFANRIRDELNPLGDSIVIGGVGDVIKLHMHSNSPGRVLECCQKYGTLHNIEIANMRDQWEENRATEKASCGEEPEAAEQTEIGIVAVAAGEGIKRLFESLGVHEIIEGGQTMNPPVEEFVNSIERVNAREVIILPNNKNLVLAAEQAKDLVSKKVEIVPSTSIPAGLAAMLTFNASLGVAENRERMTQLLNQIKVGEVTYAVRDASIDGRKIKEGDFIGLYQGKIIAVGSSLEDVVCGLTDQIIGPQDELVTLYSGADVSPEESDRILEKIRAAHPEMEVETHFGGQPVYYYLISVE